jgi:uncharacterized protein
LAKFLLLIAVFIVAYVVIRNGAQRRGAGQNQSPPGTEDMVRCKVCGIHLPRSESLTSEGEIFCSEEHQRIAKK